MSARSSILVTGAAGFIGFHTTRRLLEENISVVGVDNLNNYYDPGLKKDRLDLLKKFPHFTFYKTDITSRHELKSIFNKHRFEKVCHLAAQAGVRHSLTHPFEYERNNVLGTLTVLECMRENSVPFLVYASSSSVYGAIEKRPFTESMDVRSPLSLYGATKIANELFVEVYNHLYKLKAIGLRFFSVYGPWGRPDMALFLFTRAIINGDKIKVYNRGQMERDFTFIDDVVTGIRSALLKVEEVDHELVNLGGGRTVELMEFIRLIENELGRKSSMDLLPMQPGDIKTSTADISKARDLLGYDPQTPIEQGIREFISWYRKYYDIA